MKIPGFSDLICLHESERVAIYRGKELETQRPVILKTLRGEYPTAQDLALLKREFEILKLLKFPTIIQAYELKTFHNNLLLVLEDFGGMSLKNYLTIKPLNIEDFLKIAESLALALGDVHRKKIIHKDIKTSNIIIHRSDLTVKLTDFSISSQLTEEEQGVMNPYAFEGTLHYISPEQTGRMNRTVDYRSDYYSLGVVFYEMLSGHVPFTSQDPLEIVHSHIAKLPPPLDASIPAPIQNIIFKLLAKTPEERYQSSNGLIADLKKCEKRLKESGKIDPFSLGTKDFTDQLHTAQKLYGREKEIEKLLSAFENVQNGGLECLLISGYSGSGKSTLVAELHKKIFQRGRFVSGKFDQFTRTTPYSAFIQAITEWVHQALTASEDKLKGIRKRVQDALGKNGQVILDIVPELKLLIGEQPPLATLPLLEAQNRAVLVFQDFARALAERDSPLVIFLDDLQWADLGSLHLIELLLSDPGMKHLFFLGSFRDNEVDGNHPLTFLIQNLNKFVGLSVSNFTLSPLEKDHVTQLLSDTLRLDGKQVEELSEVIHKKTGGNPFFLNQFLKSIHKEGILSFSYESNSWKWDLIKIKEINTTDNVVDLMIKNINLLTLPAQELLKLASCIGNSFDLQTVCTVSDKPYGEIASALSHLMREGLIQPLNSNYKWLEQLKEQEIASDNISFKFTHDKVQQAAYQLIPDIYKKDVHLSLGRLLIKDSTSNIFTILNHYNLCLDKIFDSLEKEQLAKLNAEAGRKAKSSTAYQSAIIYLEAAISLMPKNCWETNYSFTFSLYQDYADSFSLVGQMEKAEQLFDILIQKSNNIWDKVDIYDSKVCMYTNTDQEKAIDTGLEALALLGVNIPKDPSVLKLGGTFLRLMLTLTPKKIQKLNNQLKPLADRKQKVISRLISSTSTPALFSHQKLWAFLLFNGFNFTLKYGYDWMNKSNFIGGLSLVFLIINKFDVFNALMDLSQKIADTTPEQSKLHDVIMGCVANNWRGSFASTIAYLDKGFYQCLEEGDLVNAHNSRAVRVQTMMEEAGYPISEIIPEAQNYLEFTIRTKEKNREISTKLCLLFLAYMQGDENVTEKVFLEGYRDFDQQIVGTLPQAWGKMYPGEFYYHNENYLEALKAWDVMYDTRNSHITGGYIGKCYLLYSLSIASYYPKASNKEKKYYWKRLKAVAKQMKIWSDVCPVNYLHKYLLIKAEIARMEGDRDVAADLYDQSFDGFQKDGQSKYAAIAAERAALFYLEKNQVRVAKTFLLEAHYGFLRWGAKRKARFLEDRYPQWLRAVRSSADTTLNITHTSSTTSTTSIDFLSILKASQAISSEIQLENLLGGLLTSVIQNAGAQSGALILEQNKQLYIYAVGEEGKKIEVYPNGMPLNEFPALPQSIFSYVQRTGQDLVLKDASQSEKFREDFYIKSTQAKSLLCVPILQQNRVSGYIYLENKLTTNAFTEERLKVLKLLAGQATISLDNARLYAACGRFVPYEFLEQIHKRNLIEVQLGDQIQREMTILFCDIRGFTAVSEQLSPAELFQLINSFLSYLGPIVKKNNGFIDKYIGDAIMALFVNPEDAIRAGLNMLEELKTFNANSKIPIGIGIGVNTGELMLGIIGEKNRIEGSVLGDAVNVASRIEALTRTYEADFLISNATKEKLDRSLPIEFHEVGEVTVKGKSKSVKIWSVQKIHDLKMAM